MEAETMDWRLSEAFRYLRETDSQAAADIRRYLAAAAATTPNGQGLTEANPLFVVLRDGHTFGSAPLTDAEMARFFGAVDAARIRFPMKQCFANAQRLWHYSRPAWSDDDTWTVEGDHVRYIEGWACTAIGIPLHHAWLSWNGKVVDLTIRVPPEAGPRHASKRLRDRVLGVIPDHWAYVGVEVAWATVRRRLVQSREWGTMLFRYWDR